MHIALVTARVCLTPADLSVHLISDSSYFVLCIVLSVLIMQITRTHDSTNGYDILQPSLPTTAYSMPIHCLYESTPIVLVILTTGLLHVVTSLMTALTGAIPPLCSSFRT
jgi:hypothetical protein